MISITSKFDRPNVLLIYMDDMTHWALTSGQCQTPNLDRIVADGTMFTHAFNQGSDQEAVCLPARQMLLTGRNLFKVPDAFMASRRLGSTLTEAGYHTFFTGKWHNEPDALAHDYCEVGPWAGGMLHSGGIGGDAYGRPDGSEHWDSADISRGGHWMDPGDGHRRHSSEVWTDAVVRFLADGRAEKPFFVHLAFHAPHDPRQAPARFLDLYPVDEVAVPPNAWSEHPFDNGALDVRDELLAPHPRTPDAVRLHRREYFAIISHADAQIGRILDALDEAGARESTLIVFSGDHGLALGEHGLMGKQNPYDHSVRVPLVFAGPGIPRGQVIDELVYSGSIYPTIVDLIPGAETVDMDFPSLAAAIAGEPHLEAPAILGAYRDVQRYVRTPTHKLVQYPQIDREQLFDLEHDPWEMDDLSAAPEKADVMRGLRARLTELQQEAGDPIVGRDVDMGPLTGATDTVTLSITSPDGEPVSTTECLS